MTKEKAHKLYLLLKQIFPEAKSELNYNNPYELLVAVILSAQCTDKRVNMVTPTLFKKFSNPLELSLANVEELEQIIHSCNYYKTKAKNLIISAKEIVEKFDNKVPNNLNDLMTLAGVGRKTANVVYSAGFMGQAIAVDTHVLRVSNRLGLSHSNNVVEVEKDLMKLFDKSVWSEVHHMLVLFGRYYCTARNPKYPSSEFEKEFPYKLEKK